jgi:hypothetical protein
MNPIVAAAAHNANLVSKAQTIINNFLGKPNRIIYAINPDGSVMELQPGVTLLSAERYRMEVFVKG